MKVAQTSIHRIVHLNDLSGTGSSGASDRHGTHLPCIQHRKHVQLRLRCWMLQLGRGSLEVVDNTVYAVVEDQKEEDNGFP